MQSVTKILLGSVLALAAAILAACGSGSNTVVPAGIRMVNDTSAALVLNLNGAGTISSVAADSSSGYLSVTPGTYTQSVSGSSTSVASSANTVGLGTGQNYTTLAYPRNNVIYSATYTDNQAVPLAGFSSLNIANVSVDAGPVDVYLVSHPFTSLTGLSPSFQSVQGLSTAVTLASTNTSATPAINYDIVVTAAGKPTDVRLTLSGPNFASAQQYTLALTGTPGGALVNSVLIPQGIAVPATAFVPTTLARVRVLSGLPVGNSIQVLATVGSTTLAPDYAPSPTHYQLVAAGSAITALTVGGAPLATLPTTTFAAGGDYTILVYGTAAAPQAVVLTDVNQVTTNFASVRVVNAAVTAPTGLTLFINGSLGPSGVLYGTDGAPNDYSGVTPASGATLQLNGAGYSGLPATFSLVTGSVYTVFVYDPTLPPLVITDR